MKLRVVTTALFLFVLSTFNAAQAAIESPEEVVKSTMDNVITKVQAKREELDAHPENMFDLIQEYVVPHFDFLVMSKLILGKRNWSQANQEQRQEFVNQFKNLLVRTYARVLLEYSDEEVNYLPVNNDPGSKLVKVKTELKGDGGTSTIPLNFILRISGGSWKVVDVSVDGVSLIGTYRGSFASEIRKSGLDSLIAKLSERNARMVTSIAE